MKQHKLVQLTALICILLLASCNSRYSLTKRHYTKGYYFNHSKNKSVSPNQEKLTATPKQAVPIQTTAKESRPDAPFSVQQSEQAALPLQVKPIPPSTKKQPVAFPPFNQKKAASFENHSFANHALEPATQPDRDRDGLSLFWIVILIILILWALGILSGSIGALINILLVIALILLILWLLRIV